MLAGRVHRAKAAQVALTNNVKRRLRGQQAGTALECGVSKPSTSNFHNKSRMRGVSRRLSKGWAATTESATCRAVGGLVVAPIDPAWSSLPATGAPEMPAYLKETISWRLEIMDSTKVTLSWTQLRSVLNLNTCAVDRLPSTAMTTCPDLAAKTEVTLEFSPMSCTSPGAVPSGDHHSSRTVGPVGSTSRSG